MRKAIPDRSDFAGFQIDKGGSLPTFDTSFLNKRKKVRDEVEKLKQQNGFNLDKLFRLWEYSQC